MKKTVDALGCGAIEHDGFEQMLRNFRTRFSKTNGFGSGGQLVQIFFRDLISNTGTGRDIDRATRTHFNWGSIMSFAQ